MKAPALCSLASRTRDGASYLRRRLAAAANWLGAHPVEIVFTLLCVAAFTYEFRITHQSFFYLDDWLFVRQSASLSRLLEPYNDAMAFSSLVTYRALMELFGFRYAPFRAVTLLCFVAVPLAYFWTTRRQFGAPLAALLALPLLWFGKYTSLFPSLFNYNLALVAGITCAAALNRGRRADWVLLGGVTVGLCSAGGGLTFVGACLLHNACTRAPIRRWLMVLLPALAWFVWWLVMMGHLNDLGSTAMTPAKMLLLARDLGYAAFENVALGSALVAVGLVGLYAAYGIWTVSKGLRHGANFLAWSSAVAFWAFGLARTRGVFVSLDTFRYRYFALVLLLLALVPARPIVWPRRFPIIADRRWVLAAAGVILVLGVARGLAVRAELQRDATFYATLGRQTRAESLVIGMGKDVTDHEPLGFDFGPKSFLFGTLSTSEVRALFSRYGQPFRTSRALADRRIVDLGGVKVRTAGTRAQRCTPLTSPLRYEQRRGSSVLLWSLEQPFAIDVRRFGSEWVRLREARPGELIALDLPWLPTPRPWQIRAPGACWAEAALPRVEGRQ